MNAMTEIKMNPYSREIDSSIAAVAKAASAEFDPAHGYDHVSRVVNTATRIALSEKADVGIVRAAAWMHDLVSLPKNDPNSKNSSRMAAAVAGRTLEELGLDPQFISAVRHAIEAHSFSAGIEPKTLEARIIRDADRIDALGAIGIARCFAVSGSINRPLFHPDDPLARNRAPSPGEWCLDTFPVKIFPRIDGVTTPSGKRIAEDRLAYMREFMTRVGDELTEAPLPDFNQDEVAS